MDLRRTVAIGVGGALGATARWALGASIGPASGFPWATFAANVVGCGLLGALLVEEWTHPRHRLVLHDLGGIGFCGGLTTLSTFAVEVVDLTRVDRAGLGVVYLAASLTVGIAAFLAAGALTRRLRALGQPLEESP